MRQYSAVKKAHPEALLFFRLGDFYELFFEDAVLAARELQITLTSRNKEKGVAVPMCGVPFHAAENYIAKLIHKGYKVAICEQMEEAGPAKKLVRREVTRVLTPGTAALQAAPEENRYLAAVAQGGKGESAVGLAILDLSTGEFRSTELSGPEAAARLREELEQWRPREILFASDAPLFAGVADRTPIAGAALTPIEEWIFAPEFSRRVLEAHFGVLSLEGYGLQDRPLAAAAAGAIVHYVKETQRSQIAHVDRLGYYERQQGLVLDAVTARNLELVEPVFAGAEAATLRAVLDATQTPMGKRLLRAWLLRPALERDEILARHAAVAVLVVDWQRRARLREELARILDLERLLSRSSLETATPRDLLALKASLDQVPRVRAVLAPLGGERWQMLGQQLADLDPLRARIADTLVAEPPAQTAQGGYIRPGLLPELDELRGLSHNAKSVIAQIETRERARTGIGSLKVRFNNVFGYYLEISRPNLPLVPADYERKQTLVNAERFTTPELKELEVKVLTAEEKILLLEARMFAELRAAVTAEARSIRRNAATLAEIDLLANFAEQAALHQYCRPEMLEEGEALEIRGGRHPVVERLGLEGVADRFVPNDCYLGGERQRVLLITGPNMGGKSTYLRQVALAVVMAQMGSFVAAESARLPLFDRIFTRIGASDNLARGRSTFMVEMTETAVIVNSATPRSLVVLDEIGRGTATYDGLSLAWAVIEYLHGQVGARTLFATHYHELTELAQHLPGVCNVHVAVKETATGIVFLRRVEPGEASRSYGIEVAKLAGLPAEIIDRARVVLRLHEATERRTGSELEAAAGAATAVQLTMFTPLSQQIVDRLSALDVDRLSPLEALNLLAELKRQLH